MEQRVKIRCFNTCEYSLEWPGFFLQASTTATRKLFDYLFQFSWKNEDSIEFLSQEMPNINDQVDRTIQLHLKRCDDDLASELQHVWNATDEKAVKSAYYSRKKKIMKYSDKADKVASIFWEAAKKRGVMFR